MKDSFYNVDQIDPKIILDYVSTAEILSFSEFSKLNRYFMNHIDETDLTIDEKCLIATYLAFSNIIMPESKNHSCTGKRKKLQQYYFDNYKYCSIETNQIIADMFKEYYDQRIKKENERDEKFLGSYYPDLYNDMMELRKVKEQQKVKNRKHG